jgi:hypothetical protein
MTEVNEQPTSEPEPRSEAWVATAEAPDDEMPTAVDTADDAPQNLEAARKLRSENRNLRQRLHEAESAAKVDVDALTARLAALERAEVERLAAQDLIDPADLWQTDVTAQSFYDDAFTQIVPDKVRDATAALIKSKPHLARPPRQATPPPTDRPIESLRPGASPEPRRTEVTWSSALRRTGV